MPGRAQEFHAGRCRTDHLRSWPLAWRTAAILAVLAALCMGGTALLEAAAAPSAEATSREGVLRGTVRLGPKLSTRRIRFSPYPDLSAAAPSRHPAPEPDEIRNVVISLVPLEGIAPSSPPAAGTFRMEQVQETFVPHVLAVPRGSKVEFVNADPIFHNVFSLSRAASFDLGRYPRGESRSVRFDEPGVVKVFCHIHSDMSAIILVLDTPYFTVPDSRGGFELSGLPPGDYTATAWHERAHPIRRTVRIGSGAAVEMDFSIPLEEAPVAE